MGSESIRPTGNGSRPTETVRGERFWERYLFLSKQDDVLASPLSSNAKPRTAGIGRSPERKVAVAVGGIVLRSSHEAVALICLRTELEERFDVAIEILRNRQQKNS